MLPATSIDDDFDDPQADLIAPGARQNRGLPETLAKLQGELRRQPENPELHFELARTLLRGGKARPAEHHLREAIRLNPAQLDPWVQLGALLERRRAYGDAVKLFQAATRTFPGNSRLWSKLGRSLRREGLAEKAVAALSEALRLNPASAEAQYELGIGLQLEGKMPEARRLLLQALQQDSTSVLYRAALASVESALDPPVTGAGCAPAARIGLHMNKTFHFSILDPIFQALKTCHPVLLATEPAQLQQFRPEVVVVADAQGQRIRARCPDATLIFVRHGLISKQHLAEAAAGCDFVAGVSSDTIRDEIVRHCGIGAERIWITGHVPMDPLFRGQRVDAGNVPLPRGNRTVLFAPTWNRKLSALGLLGERAVELLLGAREDINLIIKPHPQSVRDHRDWMATLRRSARGRRNVWLVDDPANDTMELLPLADVLVSDASSLIFAFLACDRPLVLITHPHRKQDPGYDENGIEWRWRDVGEEVTDMETLPAAIRQALEQPQLRATERAHYRKLLFGQYTDGRAAERIATRISSLPRRGAARS